MYDLALVYENPKGEKMNLSTIRRLYLQATSQGKDCVSAMEKLGGIFCNIQKEIAFVKEFFKFNDDYNIEEYHY